METCVAIGRATQSKAANRPARGVKAAGGERARLEALEARTLLAADLAVSIDNDELDLAAHLVPGERFLAPIEVFNLGPQVAVGFVDINFYLSTDATLNPGQDRLLRSYSNELVQLPRYTGDPEQVGTFEGDLPIPADMAPGTYYLIVRLVPDDDIGDFVTSNDVDVSADTTQIVLQFGTVDDRTGVALTLLDAEGTRVTFTLTGSGTGTVTPGSNGFAVSIAGAGTTGVAKITVSGGDGAFDLTGLNLQSPLGTFEAPIARLTGAITVGTSIGTLVLGDVVGPQTITIPATSARPVFVFGAVSNLSISSAVGITSITARRWLNTDGMADTITAPWLGALTTTVGAFNANLHLTGRQSVGDGAGPTLGSVFIAAGITGGTWAVNGSGLDIRAVLTERAWSASFAKGVRDVTITAVLRGRLSAKNFRSISVGRDALFAQVRAGTWYGMDGVPGGSGLNADEYGFGNIRAISVVRNVRNSLFAAGFEPLGGGLEAIVGGLNSYFGPLTIGGGTLNAQFLANQYGPISIAGQGVNWRTDSRFDFNSPPLGVTMTGSSVGADFARITVTIASFSVVNINSITSMAVRAVNPDGHEEIVTARFVGTVLGQRRGSVIATFTIMSDGPAWSPEEMGAYQFFVVADQFADTRGHTAPGGFLGMVTV